MRDVDPTLPRYGTDLVATASRDARPAYAAVRNRYDLWITQLNNQLRDV